jgi:hypothetical protein
MKRSEHSLQIAVNHMLTLVLEPALTWFSAIDHGVGRLGGAEAGIRKRRGVKPGIPDLIILWRGGNMLGIELKSGKGYLSPEQVLVHTVWGVLGFNVHVVRSLEQMQEILEAYGVPMRRRLNLFPKGVRHHEPAVRPTPPRHKRPARGRKPKDAVPVVQ